jgi:predicted double-glycine peptidase
LLLALITALSLGQSAIEVPFVPQTDALCGGASVAMVFRYWGDVHADAGQFATLIEHRAGGVAGIADGVLVSAVRAKGWRTESTDGSPAALRSRLAARQPVVVLLSERRNLYHYVVVVGISGEDMVVHDPSWGPFRVIPAADFERRWSASHHWSLVILPEKEENGARGFSRTEDGARGFSRATACDADLAHALDELGTAGLAQADDVLGPVRDRCPDSAGPVRELAAARFAERRWADAADLARKAIDRDHNDEYAHLVLGASLFMLEDQVGALRAWNAIGQPTLNRVRVEGLHRTRYQTVTDALGLRPNAILNADAFVRARHRLDELPDRAGARLALRPEDDGFASVDIVISESSDLPRGRAEWIGAGARVAINREIAVAVPGATGQGEMWSASWRFWSNRPKIAVGFAAPRVAGLSGVWRVDGSWETETYTTGGAELLRETRGHGALTVSDWMPGSLRYSLSAGLDAWGSLRAASVGASLERRWFDDRLAVAAMATDWLPLSSDGSVSGFNAVGARVRAGSRPDFRGWGYQVAAGLDRVSDNAPMTLWPGAGEGWARTPLLRAHPLLDDGAIDVSGRSVFGRSVGYGTAEAQRWLDRPAILRLGLAGFVDVGQATRQMLSNSTSSAQADLGAGLRLRFPGDSRVLRIDFAHGLRDGANALSVGWTY